MEYDRTKRVNPENIIRNHELAKTKDIDPSYYAKSRKQAQHENSGYQTSTQFPAPGWVSIWESGYTYPST